MTKLEEIIKEKEFFSLAGIYTIANALDKYITYEALSTGRAYEINPISNWFMESFGTGQGMLLAATVGNAFYFLLGYGITKDSMEDSIKKVGRVCLYLAAAHQTFVAGYCIYKWSELLPQ